MTDYPKDFVKALAYEQSLIELKRQEPAYKYTPPCPIKSKTPSTRPLNADD